MEWWELDHSPSDTDVRFAKSCDRIEQVHVEHMKFLHEEIRKLELENQQIKQELEAMKKCRKEFPHLFSEE